LKYINKILLVFAISILFTSCGIYSFTGASISPDVKTVTINYFDNRALNVQPILSQTLTEALKDHFNSQTNLDQINKNGDLIFKGYISDYKVSPVAIQGNQTAALNRLTIKINVKFTNNKDHSQDFDTSFSEYEDYESSKSIDAVEDELIKQIVAKLTEDIFNKSVANW